MATLNISAGQICVGDILGGYEVIDFDIVGDMVVLTVGKSFDDEQVWEIARDATLNVETDYLIRDEDSADGENWEDALEATIFEDDEKGADKIIENVGDLLDF